MSFSLINQALQSAESIFLNPSVLYRFEDIIRGVTVNGVRKKAVDINTTQAFGKKLTYGNFYENKKKAMEVCDEFILSNKDRILKELQSRIRTRKEMNAFGNELSMGLQQALLAYSTPSLIRESYNRTRKIVDLYLEHIVSMADEIDSETRKQLVPLLFLPIDSWIIRNEIIFDDESIDCWGLTRASSFGDIRTKDLYDEMQKYIEEKADKATRMLGKRFNAIYFDIFWGNRLNMPGGNIFGVQVAGNSGNMKPDTGSTMEYHNVSSELYDHEVPQNRGSNTSYPPLVKVLINELMESGIYIGKDYKCIKRNDGGYILEAAFPRGRRKNIVTIWPNKQGGGDIRIVGIGKYAERRRFDQNDIGTSMLKEDLRLAYMNTQ